MSENNITIRLEEKEEYREVENLVREDISEKQINSMCVILETSLIKKGGF